MAKQLLLQELTALIDNRLVPLYNEVLTAYNKVVRTTDYDERFDIYGDIEWAIEALENVVEPSLSSELWDDAEVKRLTSSIQRHKDGIMYMLHKISSLL